MTTTLRKTLAIAFAAMFAIVVTACGGSTPEDTEPTGAPPADATVVTVSATEYAFELSTTTIPAGAVSFELTNNGSMSHDLVLEGGPGGGTEVIGSGETATFNVTLEPGTYTLYCSVGNHRAQGMEIEITVE
jgi:plastocyanin